MELITERRIRIRVGLSRPGYTLGQLSLTLKELLVEMGYVHVGYFVK